MNLQNRSSISNVTYEGASFFSYDVTLLDTKVGAPVMSPVTQSIPKRLGNLFFGNEIGERTIELKVAFVHKTQQEFENLRKSFENFIIQQDTSQKELVLDDDITWSYYGVFTGLTEWENINNDIYISTLTFTCFDPLRYGKHETIHVGSDAVYDFMPKGYSTTRPTFHGVAKNNTTWAGVASSDGGFLHLGGKLDITTQETIGGGTPDDDDSIGGGIIVDEDGNVIPNDVWNPNLLLKDTAQNLSAWQRVSNDSVAWEVENGNIGKGSYLQQNTEDIDVKTFGTNQNTKDTWYGAGIERMLTKSVDDWKVRWRIQSINKYKRSETKLELYILDQNKRRIGKLSIKDTSTGQDQQAYVQVFKNSGATVTVLKQEPTVKNKKTTKTANKVKKTTTDKKGKTTTTWVTLKEQYNQNESTNSFTDFYGYLELEHYQGVYTARIVTLDPKTRNEVKRWSGTWTDKNNELSRDLAGFGMYFAKSPIAEDKKGTPYEDNVLRFCDLEVWETVTTVGGSIPKKVKAASTPVSPLALDGSENGYRDTTVTVVNTSPYTILTAGDEIHINSELGRVYKNGMIFNEALHIGSEFLEFEGGKTTQLSFCDNIDWYITYRPTAL